MATPACVPIFWNDNIGGYTSDRHPGEQSSYGFPAFFTCETVRSTWRHLGYLCGGQCCQGSGLVLDVLRYPGGVSLWVLTSGGFAWISLFGDLVPTPSLKQYGLRSLWWCMWWSVLSRVRVIANSAERSLFLGGGLPVGADFGWLPGGSRCSAEHEFKLFIGTCGYSGCVDGCSSSTVSGCQWISCSHSRDTGVPRISGGDYWGVTEVVSSVSIKVSTDRSWRSLPPSGGTAVAPLRWLLD